MATAQHIYQKKRKVARARRKQGESKPQIASKRAKYIKTKSIKTRATTNHKKREREREIEREI